MKTNVTTTNKKVADKMATISRKVEETYSEEDLLQRREMLIRQQMQCKRQMQAMKDSYDKFTADIAEVDELLAQMVEEVPTIE